MNVLDAVSVFTKGDIGKENNIIDTNFFSMELKDILQIIKRGYHYFSHDFIILVSCLMKLEPDVISKRIASLRHMTRGSSKKFEDDIFKNINVAFIRTTSFDPIFEHVGTPLCIISTDGGDLWTGVHKGRVRTVPIDIWVKVYYSGLLAGIAFDPLDAYFYHDIRRVSVFTPKKDHWSIFKTFIVDSRSLENLKQTYTIYKYVPGVPRPPMIEERTSQTPPPPHISSGDGVIRVNKGTPSEPDVLIKKGEEAKSERFINPPPDALYGTTKKYKVIGYDDGKYTVAPVRKSERVILKKRLQSEAELDESERPTKKEKTY